MNEINVLFQLVQASAGTDKNPYLSQKEDVDLVDKFKNLLLDSVKTKNNISQDNKAVEKQLIKLIEIAEDEELVDEINLLLKEINYLLENTKENTDIEKKEIEIKLNTTADNLEKLKRNIEKISNYIRDNQLSTEKTKKAGYILQEKTDLEEKTINNNILNIKLDKPTEEKPKDRKDQMAKINRNENIIKKEEDLLDYMKIPEKPEKPEKPGDKTIDLAHKEIDFIKKETDIAKTNTIQENEIFREIKITEKEIKIPESRENIKTTENIVLNADKEVIDIENPETIKNNLKETNQLLAVLREIEELNLNQTEGPDKSKITEIELKNILQNRENIPEILQELTEDDIELEDIRNISEDKTDNFIKNIKKELEYQLNEINRKINIHNITSNITEYINPEKINELLDYLKLSGNQKNGNFIEVFSEIELDEQVDKVKNLAKSNLLKETIEENSNKNIIDILKTGNSENENTKNSNDFQVISSQIENMTFINSNQSEQVFDNPNSQQVFLTDIIGQISEQLQQMQKNSRNQIRLQLEPEYLGKVDLRLEVNSGEISARFIVENLQSKEYLEQNIYRLRDNLLNEGFNVQQLEIESEEQGSFDLQQQFNQYSGGQNHNNDGNISDDLDDFFNFNPQRFEDEPQQQIYYDRKWKMINNYYHRMNLLV